MPRSARLDFLDIVQHVMSRGIEGCTIFSNNADRVEFLRRLSDVVITGQAELFAWCLMSNHFHILLRPRVMSLADMMRRLNTGYAVWHNRQHRRQGHLFQNRYKSIVVEEDPYFLELIRYIHLNPARAGLIKTIAELDQYPYTGHSVIMGKRDFSAQDVGTVLSRFSDGRTKARSAYRRYLVEGFSQGKRDDLCGGGLVRVAGGWKELIKRKKEERELGDERVLGSGMFVEALLDKEETSEPCITATIDSILSKISNRFGITQEQILGKSREHAISRARRAFFLLANEQGGQSMAALARLTSRSQPAVWQAIQQARHEATKIKQL